MRLMKFLEDIGAGYLFVLFGGFALIFYIIYRGYEMYPN